MNPLDIDYVRKQFPGLAGGFAYMDNAGGSMVLSSVAQRVSDYLLNNSVQLGASYQASVDAGERVMQARHSVMQLINAEHPEEVIMEIGRAHV